MKEEREKETQIDFTDTSSIELLEYISWKDDFPIESKRAFVEFCSRFEKIVIKKASVYGSKYGYNEVIALDLAHCTFNRVWKYASSFDRDKSQSKTDYGSIVKWLIRILYTQLVKLKDSNTCMDINEDESLETIKSIGNLAELMSSGDIERKKELILRLEILEKAFLGLSKKHKVIYLTYKAYEKSGKNIPRSVTKKLREELNLKQPSIRVYKNEAYEHVRVFLKQLNEGSK